jgi:hypothetical protein
MGEMRRGLRLHVWLVALVGGLAIGTILYAQGFNARTGTWEFTVVIKGGMPMEGVPPAVAAQIQASLAKPQTSTSCLTAADLKNLNLGRMDDSDDEDCKILSAKVTPTVADITRECTGDDPYTETAHFEAPTPQTVRGDISRKTAKGTMTMTMTGKWVAAACME